MKILGGLLVGLSVWCWSDVLVASSQEREELTRLLHELQRLDRIVASAERHADKDARLRLRYQQLTADLQAIQQGVADYLSREPRDPRGLPAIEGRY